MKCIYTKICGVKVFSDNCKLWWILKPLETKTYLFCGYTLKELAEKIKEIREVSDVKKTYIKSSIYQKT